MKRNKLCRCCMTDMDMFLEMIAGITYKVEPLEDSIHVVFNREGAGNADHDVDIVFGNDGRFIGVELFECD